MGARDISLPVLMRIHSLFGVGHTVEDVHRMLNEEPAEVDPRADDLLAAQASLLAHQADALGQRITMLTGQLRSVGLRPAPGYDGAMADDLVPARLEELSATVHALRHEVAGLRGGVPSIATDDGAVIDGGAIGDALRALAATLTELPRRVASEVDRAVAARIPDGAPSSRPHAPAPTPAQAPAQINEAPQPQPPQARPQHDAPPLPLHLFSRIESRPFSLDMLWRKHLFEVPARARMWLVMAPLLIALGAAAAYILVSPDAAELLELLLTGLDEK